MAPGTGGAVQGLITSVPMTEAWMQATKKSSAVCRAAPLIVLRLHICQPERRVPGSTGPA